MNKRVISVALALPLAFSISGTNAAFAVDHPAKPGPSSSKSETTPPKPGPSSSSKSETTPPKPGPKPPKSSPKPPKSSPKPPKSSPKPESTPTALESTEIPLKPQLAKTDQAAVDAYKAVKENYDTATLDLNTTKASLSEDMASYRLAINEFKPALASYATAKKVIGKTFSTALTKARDAYKQSTGASATADQKLAAKSTFEDARDVATALRNAAIQALGAPPVKPAAPARKTPKQTPSATP